MYSVSPLSPPFQGFWVQEGVFLAPRRPVEVRVTSGHGSDAWPRPGHRVCRWYLWGMAAPAQLGCGTGVCGPCREPPALGLGFGCILSALCSAPHSYQTSFHHRLKYVGGPRGMWVFSEKLPLSLTQTWGRSSALPLECQCCISKEREL